MSDINELLKRIDTYLEATEIAKGKTLIGRQPLEIHLYNIATYTTTQLREFKAMLEDAQGTYLKKDKQ